MKRFESLTSNSSFFSLMILLLGFLTFSSCKSEYDQLVKSEMSTGIQHDSLIFNLFLGEKKQEFYSKCWELNKQQIISQGSGNKYARYLEPIDSTDEKKLRKQMDFFGIFDKQEVMRGMEMVFTYIAWSPWNEKVQGDALLKSLKIEFEEKYPGNSFIKVDIKEANKTAYVKVDGNLQILMFRQGEKEVMVKMEDLNYKLNN